MANPEKESSGVERGEAKSELRASKAEVKRASKTERADAEADLTRRGVEAGATIDRENEREKTREKESVMAKERGTAEKEKPAPVKAARRIRPKPHTKKDREQVFTTEIKQVQAQMSPTSRAFSKVIHNKAIEKVSDGAQKTVFRPSALIGGAVLGLVLGILIYIIAQAYHYSIGSYEILVLFIVGALVGVIVELVTKRVRS